MIKWDITTHKKCNNGSSKNQAVLPVVPCPRPMYEVKIRNSIVEFVIKLTKGAKLAIVLENDESIL